MATGGRRGICTTFCFPESGINPREPFPGAMENVVVTIYNKKPGEHIGHTNGTTIKPLNLHLVNFKMQKYLLLVVKYLSGFRFANLNHSAKS